MAETTAPPPAAPAPKPAAPAAKQPAAKTARPPAPPAATGVTRREFLYYVWGASMALFLAETTGISVLFALPRFREGEFGGKITVNASDFPKVNDPPVANNQGKFWMVTTDKGVLALYKVCTHLGCIYAWDNLADRFACPCHGSQFQEDGAYIAGPAPRSLDKFAQEAYNQAGKLVANSDDGSPMPLPSDAVIVKVNTGKKILGKSHF
ncbi:MAG: Rieske 2Fe-2S domain-containing protein [Chloroflexi bacterium]|nr:Rieske 2Fe-2S domain-containing protein [Chloroflexota bacterium]MCL5275234.1 Rieske 2Fe-2S domain-containing protein [Chloroflexota bacterium]